MIHPTQPHAYTSDDSFVLHGTAYTRDPATGHCQCIIQQNGGNQRRRIGRVVYDIALEECKRKMEIAETNCSSR